MPGTGLLAACVPGSFGGWLLLLEQFGTWRLDDVLAFAIGYAEHGYPVVPGITVTIERVARCSCASGRARRRSTCPLPRRAPRSATRSSRRRGGAYSTSPGAVRVRQELERARQVYYEGFIAEEIDRFSREHDGLLTGDDLTRWRATLEPPATVDYRGSDRLQDRCLGAGAMPRCSSSGCSRASTSSSLSEAELVHLTTECAKLAFADRDANYGDSADVPLERLLSREYADERRALIGDEASGELRPGLGRLPRVRR